jgi:ubiquinone/menaquinone biosynthesis C-methylase UbiE
MSHAQSPLDYDRLAADYARHRRLHPGVLANLIERGGLTSVSRVLEVGCGTGNYISAISERAGCPCGGLDPSAEMLATAREQAPAIAFLQGRAESLPFEDESIDLLFSVDVIHHVGDRPAFFREALRVLSPGGRICTATDSEDDIARRRPLSSHFPETVAVELRRYPRIGVLHGEMSDAGFAEVGDAQVELAYELSDVQPYRDRAFSSLHLIDDAAFAAGLARLESELRQGSTAALSLYTLVWGRKP